MTEYISREEALNFELEIEAKPDDIQAITKGMALYADYIKNIPAADVVEQKKGQWIKTIDEYGETWMCSQCCEEWTVEETVFDEFPNWAHYCPNCGTAMN